MEFLKVVCILLTVIALLCFFYKIHLQNKIQKPDTESGFFSIVIRPYSLVDFFPLLSNPYKQNNKLRRRANVALLFFYLCFLSIIVITSLVKIS